MAGKHEGQVILITGSARGIGLEMAKYLSGLGARIVIADVDGRAAEESAAALPGEALAVACDVTDEASVAAMADRVLVMHRGGIVEAGETRQVLRQPRADYTRRLLEAVPKLRRT